jgi:O-antigen/teichoic acid export membrane protein
LQTLLVVIVGVGLVTQAVDVVDLWFQAKLLGRLTATARVVALLGGATAKVACVISAAPLPYFALATAFETLLYASALSVAYQAAPIGHAWRWSFTRARALVADAWPFIVSGVAIMVYMRINQVMLQALDGAAGVGLYAAVLPFSDTWNVIPTAICTSAASTFARLRITDRAAYERRLQQLFRFMFVLSAGIALVTTLLSRMLVEVLLGPAYVVAAPVLAIQVWSAVFVFIGVAQSIWIVNENRGRILMLQTALGAITAVCCNLVLIPKFGVAGAAVTTLISYGVSAYLSNLVVAPRLFWMQTRALLLWVRP